MLLSCSGLWGLHRLWPGGATCQPDWGLDPEIKASPPAARIIASLIQITRNSFVFNPLLGKHSKGLTFRPIVGLKWCRNKRRSIFLLLCCLLFLQTGCSARVGNLTNSKWYQEVEQAYWSGAFPVLVGNNRLYGRCGCWLGMVWGERQVNHARTPEYPNWFENAGPLYLSLYNFVSSEGALYVMMT